MPQNKVQTPIADMLEKYNNEQNVRFHMPGHKGRCTFDFFLKNMFEYDVTEVSGTDNLHNPTGAIREAELLLAKAYSAEKSHILVNGSTCGILSVITAVFEKGDRVILDTNSHYSVYNAMELAGAELIKIQSITAEKIVDTMAKYKIKGVVITRPTYFGRCSDIKSISQMCRENNVLLITDEAHGAHLNFAKQGYPESAVKYSDFTIQSAHKTLGALNQSAYLHLNGQGMEYAKKIKKKLAIFQTASPSYLIMASADSARAHMEEYGADLLEKLRKNIIWVSKELEKYTDFYISSDTPDRLVIKTDRTKYTGFFLEKYLRTRSLQVEMSAKDCIVCLCSIFDEVADFEKLVEELKKIENFSEECNKMSEENEFLENLKGFIGEKITSDIMAFPPGIPIVRCGEVLTEEIFNEIAELNAFGANIVGY